MRPLIIIHGWSDDSDSFRRLAELIKSNTNRKVEHLWLGDYVSLDNDIQMSDIISAMNRAWSDGEPSLPMSPNSCDAIVHSTGGLIIRKWMADYWHAKSKDPPIANLVMLAPANFGSPLAHRGRSLIGRVVKGFHSEKRFQTGTHILKALEMASPYSWELASDDRFDGNVFDTGGVRCTVIVGNAGYGGISSLANENGSDGTVYVSTANLNCAKLTINFADKPNQPSMLPLTLSKGETAFLVVENKNHSTIAFKDTNYTNYKKHLNWVIEALDVDVTGFDAWRRKCGTQTDKVMAANAKKRDPHTHGYQNTIFRVRDDMGNAVDDYVLEFYQNFDKQDDEVAKIFNRNVVGSTHAYSDDRSMRSFMINCTRLFNLIDTPEGYLKVRLSALPNFEDENNVVGYRTIGVHDIGSVELNRDKLAELFKHNRTVLVDIILKRYQEPKVFSIKSYGESSRINPSRD